MSLLTITLNWVGSDLDATLVDPDDITIDPDTDPNVEYSGSDVKQEWYRITNPKPGNRQLKVFDKDTPAAGESYFLNATAQTTLTFNAATDKTEVMQNEPVKLIASAMSDGMGESGATVNATITRPGASQETLNLVDRGDGTYDAFYVNTNLTGVYKIRVKGEKTVVPKPATTALPYTWRKAQGLLKTTP